MAPQLHMSERRVGDVVVVSLSGRLIPDDDDDLLFRAHIDSLVQQGFTKVVIDLQRLHLLDSGGVGVLVAKLLTLRRRGGDLRLSGLTDRTSRVLAITQLDAIFQIFGLAEDAVQSFNAPCTPHVSLAMKA